MGYYTRYKLSVVNNDGSLSKPSEEMLDNIGKISRYGGNMFEDEIKWYDWRDDMLEFSRSWKECVFRLDGWGEDNIDLWTAYFKDGKYVVHKMGTWIAPLYNEGELS